MNFVKSLTTPAIEKLTTAAPVSAALLALRLVVGTAFIAHGYSKILSPFSWMGPDAPVPGFLQALAAFAEVGGGVALILGLLTPLAALGLIVTMIVAVLFHVTKGDAFVGGYELALVYLVNSVVLFAAGPGRFSIDALIAAKRASRGSDYELRHARIG